MNILDIVYGRRGGMGSGGGMDEEALKEIHLEKGLGWEDVQTIPGHYTSEYTIKFAEKEPYQDFVGIKLYHISEEYIEKDDMSGVQVLLKYVDETTQNYIFTQSDITDMDENCYTFGCITVSKADWIFQNMIEFKKGVVVHNPISNNPITEITLTFSSEVFKTFTESSSVVEKISNKYLPLEEGGYGYTTVQQETSSIEITCQDLDADEDGNLIYYDYGINEEEKYYKLPGFSYQPTIVYYIDNNGVEQSEAFSTSKCFKYNSNIWLYPNIGILRILESTYKGTKYILAGYYVSSKFRKAVFDDVDHGFHIPEKNIYHLINNQYLPDEVNGISGWIEKNNPSTEYTDVINITDVSKLSKYAYAYGTSPSSPYWEADILRMAAFDPSIFVNATMTYEQNNETVTKVITSSDIVTVQDNDGNNAYIIDDSILICYSVNGATFNISNYGRSVSVGYGTYLFIERLNNGKLLKKIKFASKVIPTDILDTYHKINNKLMPDLDEFTDEDIAALFDEDEYIFDESTLV